jgi:crossover junction endodeoxyribonuclease RusA
VIRITLPWPPSTLNPNTRLHWAALAKHKARYRAVCQMATETQRGAWDCQIPDGPLRLSLIFYRPTRRSYDRDNLLARMKSGLDGMCDSMRINDKRFATLVIRVADEIKNVVQVEIERDGTQT